MTKEEKNDMLKSIEKDCKKFGKNISDYQWFIDMIKKS